MLIYQLTNSTPKQMMCYIIKTKNGRVIAVDGGWYDQADELIKVLNLVGNHVDMWFLTHDHCDHFGAMINVMNEHKEISVDKIYCNSCKNPKVLESFSAGEMAELETWLEFEETTEVPIERLELSQKLSLDGVEVEVLGINNPEILVNNPNNQSVVLKFSEGDFSMIFLGDLGVEGGKKLIEISGDKLKSSAVQMAHHGQAGVSKEVYEKISPTYAFWPTPDWLWENNLYCGGGEPDSGPFLTPQTIEWMKELGTKNITSFSETVVFDTKTQKTDRI